MNGKVDYGNWVPKKMLRTSYLVILFLAAVIGAAFSRLTGALNPELVLFLRVVSILAECFMLCLSGYFTISYHLFSYTGKYKIQERIVDYVVGQLNMADENGKILDIGCGSGAVSIKTAKKFPHARLTSIDYWGRSWDYAKQQCEQNARIEGVDDRITFKKGDAAALAFPDESFDGAISNFVFHEVAAQPDKRLMVKEALRIVKKGGSFVFHDLFLDESLYGSLEELAEELRKEGISRVGITKTADILKIPALLKTRFMIGKIALLYGQK